MPDYERTLIYKVACKDPNFKDFFIGATCNFAGQKWKHHNISKDHAEKRYNWPPYDCIRKTGGWHNWEMVLIEVFPCEDKLEKEARLRYWKEELKPTLNTTNSNRMTFDDYRQLWEKENRKTKRIKRIKKRTNMKKKKKWLNIRRKTGLRNIY